MKKIFVASLFVFSAFAAFSQSDNRQTRKLSGFHGIDVSGGIDLYLQTGSEAVSVSASTNEVRDHIVTEVVNGVLRIHLQENWNPENNSNTKMRAYVSVEILKTLEASGGGDVVFQNKMKSDNLVVSLSGGGNLSGSMDANHLVISQSGGSAIKLSGNVKNLELSASGGSNMDAYGLITDYTSVHSSGGSETEITVNKELRVVTSGGGGISYRGTAAVREIKSSGGGSVSHKD